MSVFNAAQQAQQPAAGAMAGQVEQAPANTGGEVAAAAPMAMQNTAGGAASVPMTLEGVLGINMQEAQVLEGIKVHPEGNYMLQLADVNTDEYEIKKEDHAFVGQKAPIVEFNFKIVNISHPLKDVDGNVLTNEQGAALIGEDVREAFLFGNDGLPDPKNPAVIKHPARDKMRTFLGKMVGEDVYAGIEQRNNGSLQGIIGECMGKTFVCEITHNVNPNDPNKRKNHQINLFGTFMPAAQQ